MVRTADSNIRVSGGKSAKKVATSGGGNSSSSRTSSSQSSDKVGGGSGNSVCPRETPSWQKPITTFFNKPESTTHKEIQDNSSSKDHPTTEISQKNGDVGNNVVKKTVEYHNGAGTSASSSSADVGDDKVGNSIKLLKNVGNGPSFSENVDCEDKENNPPKKELEQINGSRSSVCNKELIEMEGSKQKHFRSDDDEDIPAKRKKPNKQFYKHLEEIEEN